MIFKEEINIFFFRVFISAHNLPGIIAVWETGGGKHNRGEGCVPLAWRGLIVAKCCQVCFLCACKVSIFFSLAKTFINASGNLSERMSIKRLSR